MMAVAAHVLDGAPPPRALSLALNCQRWNVDVMQLPAGWMVEANIALNTYQALISWRQAGNSTAEWTRRNPQAWELVSWILQARRERKRGT